MAQLQCAEVHEDGMYSCTDMAIRLEVDGLAMGSSASKKSWSLELLLTLHTVVSAATSSIRMLY